MKSDTILRWHRRALQLLWRWKSKAEQSQPSRLQAARLDDQIQRAQPELESMARNLRRALNTRVPAVPTGTLASANALRD